MKKYTHYSTDRFVNYWIKLRQFTTDSVAEYYLKQYPMKALFLGMLLVYLVGCQSVVSDGSFSEEKEVIVKIPDDLQSKGQLVLSEIADSIFYIPLETSNDCLISEIKDIQCIGEKLFVRSNKNELFCFLNSGKFLNRIGKRGKGPSEYYSLIDFAVNDEFVYILDYSKRIAVYSHKGEFKGYIKTSRQASRIMALPDGELAFYVPDSQFQPNEDRYSWFIIDNSGNPGTVLRTPSLRDNNVDKKYLSNHFVLTNFSSTHSFAFKEAFNDTLYFIDPSTLKITSYGYIDEGIHKINYKSTFEQVASAKHNMRINRIVDIPGYMFVSYKCMCNNNHKSHQAVYNKLNHTFFNLESETGVESVVYDEDTGLGISVLSCVNKSRFVGCINAFAASENGVKLLNDWIINEQDNPIVVFISGFKYKEAS